MIQKMSVLTARARDYASRLAHTVTTTRIQRNQRGVVVVDYIILLAIVLLVGALVYNTSRTHVEAAANGIWQHIISLISINPSFNN